MSGCYENLASLDSFSGEGLLAPVEFLVRCYLSGIHLVSMVYVGTT